MDATASSESKQTLYGKSRDITPGQKKEVMSKTKHGLPFMVLHFQISNDLLKGK